MKLTCRLMQGNTLRSVILPPLRAALGWWMALGCLVGCAAEPPSQRPGSFPEPEEDIYPFRARCTPDVDCPGRSCADNVLGPPDDLTVDMGACATLDLFFSGGIIRTPHSEKEFPDDPDLAIHLGRLDGLSRVEASADGLDYSVVGYLTRDLSLLPVESGKYEKNCLAEAVGDRALVYFNRCTTTTNVSFIRIVGDLATSGSADIDAVEALTFCPWEDTECSPSS